MRSVFTFAVGSLLLAAVSVHALTQTPIDLQPYGLITEAQVPAAAATCKAALDAAVKTVTAANGDFTGVTQPTGATLANSEYLYCFSAPGYTDNVGTMELTVFPGALQGKTLTQELTDTAWPQVASFMSLVLNQVQQMMTTPQYAVLYYAWDVKDQANKTPTQMKYDLVEGFTVGAKKYGCGCGYKLVSYGNVVGAYSTTAPSG